MHILIRMWIVQYDEEDPTGDIRRRRFLIRAESETEARTRVAGSCGRHTQDGFTAEEWMGEVVEL